MSTLLEYTLSLKDRVTGVMSKIGIKNDMMLDHFARLEKKSHSVSNAFAKMGTSVHTLQQKIELLKNERDLLPESSLRTIRQYNSEIHRLEGRVTRLQTLNGNPIKRMLGDALNSLPGFATNPAVLVGAGIGAAVRKGMEADMQKANMLTLYKGNEAAAKEMYDKIAGYGKISPYEKGDLLEVQKVMMSFGIEGNKSFGVLQQIGDIAMGDAGKMQSLALAFSQATSAGKLQGQDLMQMINAGFNPLQIISERTGESMESLKDRMGKGAIGATELAQAFEWATDANGLFYKGAEKAGATLGGKWSTLMDSLSEMLLSIYSAIAPILMPLIENVTALMDGLGQGIGYVVNGLKEGNPLMIATAGILGAITVGYMAYTTWTSIATMLQDKFTLSVLKTNFAFMMNPIFQVVAVLALLAGGIYYAYTHSEKFRATIAGLWEAIKTLGTTIKDVLLERIYSLLRGLGGVAKALFLLFKGEFGKAADAGKQAILDLAGVSVAQKMYEGGKNVANAYRRGFAERMQSEQWAVASKLPTGVRNPNFISTGDRIASMIAPPKVPGAAMSGAANANANVPNGNNNSAGKQTTDAIATGGTKNTTINIQNGVKIEQLTIANKGGFKESTKEMEDMLIDSFTRALVMGASLGT